MKGSPPSGGTRLALLGLALGIVGIVSYFVVALHFGAWLPRVRNSAQPNLTLVLVGLALSAVGVRRALTTPGGRGGRWLAPVLASFNIVLAAAFAWILYGISAVPPVSGPAIGASAPDFAAVDQNGRTTRLADFRGSPLLLVFYRGHW
jgi:hypothetical protein